MSYLAKAIHNLKPGAEFSFTDENYSTIKWDVLDGSAPTIKQIDDEIKRIKDAEAAKPAAKSALLERLGITADEAALLLS
jgi:hypothetical protein